MSQWGHDFRPEYLQPSVLHERFPAVPRIALTATADPQTRAEIMARLALDAARVFVSSFDRPNIRYTIVDKDDAARRSCCASSATSTPARPASSTACRGGKVDETAAWLAAQRHRSAALPRRAWTRRRAARTRPASSARRAW